MTAQTAKAPVKGLVLLTYAAMIVVNVLANGLPINGRTTGAVSDSYPNLFAPAGLTFAIWGIIYLLLGTHVLYQIGLFHHRDPQRATSARAALLGRVGILFSLSSLVNVAWILSWHYDLIGISTVLLATMLVLLIWITRTIAAVDLSARDRLLIRLPFSVYFGWITVATIANITVWLVSIGWTAFGIAPSTWALAIIAVGAAIGTTVILRASDLAYGLVLVWAYLGIWIKHTSQSGFQSTYPAVIATTIVGIVAFIIAGTIVIRRTRTAAQRS